MVRKNFYALAALLASVSSFGTTVLLLSSQAASVGA